METEKRLIDKQTAIELLRGKCVSKYPSTFVMGLFAAADEIEKIPEVDAAEVVHGKWVCPDFDFSDYWKCSACNEEFYFEYDPTEIPCNYCPNCGAKMDRGVDNENL